MRKEHSEEPVGARREVTVTAGTDELSLRTQALRFIASGAASAIVDLTITAALQYAAGWSTELARTVGFIFGTLSAYMINRRWTFRAEPSLRRFLAVCLLYATTYVINIAGYSLGFSWLTSLGFENWLATGIAFVVSQGTATVVNFIIQRTVIFRLVR